ncbi:MAG: hypothetical protein ACOCRX_09835 [Candidatus Woesearchaeota archaeon]
MNKFNLKESQTKNYNKMLEDNTKEKNPIYQDNKNINYKNKKQNHKDIKKVINENRMDKERQGSDDNKVIEKNLNTNKNLEIADRNKEWDTTIKPENLLSEAYDQEKLEVFNQNLDDKKERDTSFWDDYVGDQMDESERTKIIKNKSNSQLHNKSERFNNLTPENVIENKNFSYDEKTAVALKKADADLLNIYLTAFSQKRDLNNNDKYKISMINNYKKKILSQQLKDIKDDQEKAKQDALNDIRQEEDFNMVNKIEDTKEKGEKYDLELVPQDDGSVYIYHNGKIIDVFDKYEDVNENIQDATAQYYPYI